MPTMLVDFTLGMEPIKPIYAPPWANPLPVTTIIPTKDEAVAVLQALLMDVGFTSSTWYCFISTKCSGDA
jgi:hypothetical protein